MESNNELTLQHFLTIIPYLYGEGYIGFENNGDDFRVIEGGNTVMWSHEQQIIYVQDNKIVFRTDSTVLYYFITAFVKLLYSNDFRVTSDCTAIISVDDSIVKMKDNHLVATNGDTKRTELLASAIENDLFKQALSDIRHYQKTKGIKSC